MSKPLLDLEQDAAQTDSLRGGLRPVRHPDRLPAAAVPLGKDTVLADILEEADFEITGIAADLLKIHQNSKDRESVETCFEVLTGWTIPDYLKKCIATILEQKNKAVSNSKECLLYQGMQPFSSGKEGRKRRGRLSSYEKRF